MLYYFCDVETHPLGWSKDRGPPHAGESPAFFIVKNYKLTRLEYRKVYKKEESHITAPHFLVSYKLAFKSNWYTTEFCWN